tara:strand:- start:113 stop:1273 length:1161 start_codon:yes stop_codon:yes gene_type:complete
MRTISNVRLPSPEIRAAEEPLWSLLVQEDGVIQSISPQHEEDHTIAGENWGGDYISPMGVDLQINGGLGISFYDLKAQDLPRILDLLDLLWVDGVEAICPTFVSCDQFSLRRGLEFLRIARTYNSSNRCELLGAHLEGPFLATERRGAHSLDFIRSPSVNNLEKLIEGFENEISIVTIAPELPNAFEVIEKLKMLGIVVSLGHSSANANISKIAFEKGITMLTHTFNAMPGLGHREPGPIGEAIHKGDIAMGLIADGIHVHPKICNLLMKIASHQLVLVSDVISSYGLSDGEYQWDTRTVISSQGVCRLKDGTLAGSSLPLLEGSKRLANWSGDHGASIWSATVAPRLSLDGCKSIYEYLIGQSLTKLLRWQVNHDSSELSWHMAA